MPHIRSRGCSRALLAGACAFAIHLIPAPTAAQDMAVSVAGYEPTVTRGLDFPLTIQNIMRGTELVGEAPVAVSWTDDSRWIYFRWRPAGGAWSDQRSLYRVPAQGGEPERLTEAAADSLAPLFAGGDLSEDRRWRVSSVDGDLYLVDRRRMSSRRLTHTTQPESRPRFMGGDAAVTFMSDGNLVSLNVEDGALRQLTNLREGDAPKEDPEATGFQLFLERQQQELFEHVRTDSLREARSEAAKELREAKGLPPVHLGKGVRLSRLEANATGSAVVVVASRPADSPKRTVVPDWVTESGYTEDLDTRPKVGDDQSAPLVGMLDPVGGTLTWLTLLPDSAVEDPAVPRTGQGELARAAFHGWNEAGTHGLISAVDYDFKAWRLYAVDSRGSLSLLHSLEDEAWVGGPCFQNCIGWFPGTSRAWFVSEDTGYAHLYTIEHDGSGRRALTSGEWEVLSVSIPEDRRTFLVRTSQVSPFDAHVYRMDFDGGGMKRLVEGSGSFVATPSPNGRRVAVVHSRSNRPPELFVADLEEGAELEQVTVSPSVEWLTFPWIEPEIVHVSAEDGTQVPARIYRPRDVGATANGAGVIFVHGAGYLHNVHNWWSNYYREYMFHHFLAANGYTVLDVDYRGSAGYGRDWRVGIYRWMGGKDLSDQSDGARYLAREEDVDPSRIGLYGGSYGGFITLMALFTEPDLFKSGAALRSVTDWAHYNHGYTSRILNLAHEDEEAYRKSSPIYFAENFRGHLLMAHGMVDTNVHFSDVVRLAQRLIELGKENWEMAVYPVENHGFIEPSSWTDEYRRIFELFQRTLREPGTQVEAGGN